MPEPRASDVGPLYDFMLSTRDGSPLECKDARGNIVSVSKMAYMCVYDKQRPMSEATELQEKANLIQFGTSNLIDREFDQWPQVSQGDWTSGAGQRVYGSNGDTNGYFDGEGLIWPLNDVVPQVPFPQDPVIAPPASLVSPIWSDTVGGYLAGFGNGYAIAFGIINGANWNTKVRFYSGDANAEITLVTGSKVIVLAGFVGNGSLWLVTTNQVAGGNITLYQLDWAAGPVLVATTTTQIVTDLAAAGAAAAVVTAALIGNRAYVAVALSYKNATTNLNQITIYDFTGAGAPTNTVIAFPSNNRVRIADMNFQGGQLFISVTDGFNTSIVSSPPPWGSVATTAVLPGIATALMTSVGSAIFIAGYSQTLGGNINRVGLFVLESGALTELGPINTMRATSILSVGSPTTFDSYALFPVIYTVPGATTKTIAVYAFDVPRARLFRAFLLTKAGFTGSSAISHDGLAVFGSVSRTHSSGATFSAQWGIAISTEQISSQAEMAEEFYYGLVPLTPTPSFTGLLQMGANIYSGIIDFTASSNKLYRQVIADFVDGLLEGKSTPSVTLKVWFDQDPGQLAATPSATDSTNPPTGRPLPTQLALPVNTIARKMVYNVTSTGGGVIGGLWQNSPKLVSVKVQASTGWVWDMVANLNKNVGMNGGKTQDYAYQNQSIPNKASVDHVVAYNFLKQLWRQKGGQCLLDLPNKDSYPALIQLERFESPKPFAASFRADEASNYQNQVTLKIREDL